MPSDFLYMDTNFPTFTGSESTEDKVSTIQNYLYMMLEQLRYTLNNLDKSNFNATAYDEAVTEITSPITAKIEDTDKNVAQLSLTAKGLSTRVEDAEGNISAMEQTISGFTFAVQDSGGNSTVLQLKSGQAVLASVTITFSGLVTFTDLSQSGGSTVINGGNITTGTISAITLTGNTITGGTMESTSLTSTTISSSVMKSSKLYACELYASYGNTTDFAVMTQVGLEIYVSSGRKAFLGLNGGYNGNPALILGDTSSAYVEKYYVNGNNCMWVGDSSFSTGIRFNFDAGTYMFFGTQGS